MPKKPKNHNFRAFPKLSGYVEELKNAISDRRKATVWAQDLKFLTFEPDIDGEDERALVHRSDDYCGVKGQCRRCEERLPPPTGHLCSLHMPNAGRKWQRDERFPQFANPCIHVRERSCDLCAHIPLFPSDKPIRKFRIRNLREGHPEGPTEAKLQCDHFVAVSYTLFEDAMTKNPSVTAPYQVLENGEWRNARASKDVIDRAVDFAIQNGFRMIWIDQECIDQTNDVEKEESIQAMDNVYARARITIGLCRVALQQKHLDAYAAFYENASGCLVPRRAGPHIKRFHSYRLHDLAQMLTMFAHDGWNSRAWIVQEALLSRRNLVLLFPRTSITKLGDWSAICQSLSMTEVAMSLENLNRAIHQAVAVIFYEDKRSRRHLPKDWNKTVDTMLRLSPSTTAPISFDCWINNDKPRVSCKAAVAYTLLKDRNCGREWDLLAIFGNLCNYSFRFNTFKLSQLGVPIETCMLALSLMNGDFSLLVPQHYRGVRMSSQDPADLVGDFGFLPSASHSFQRLSADSTDPSGPVVSRNNINLFQLSDQQFHVPGCLWEMTGFIDLTSLKEYYAENWFNLKRVYSSPLRGLHPIGKRVKGRARAPRAHHLATTQLVLEILLHLRREGHIQVADAIWHSTMNAQWAKDVAEHLNETDDQVMIESVEQFPADIRMERRKNMFALNEYQVWLIDQIMSHGRLWVARYAGSDSGAYIKPSAKQMEAQAETSSAAPNGDVPAEEVVHRDQDSLEESDDGEAAVSEGAPKVRGRWHQQFTNSLMVKLMVHSMTLNQGKGDDRGPDDLKFSPEALLDLTRALTRDESYDIEQKGQCAIFDVPDDVEKGILIFTPYDRRLETIPRPQMRDMSVSWVVEKLPAMSTKVEIHDGNDAEDGESVERTVGKRLKFRKCVRGMWKVQYQSPLDIYTFGTEGSVSKSNST